MDKKVFLLDGASGTCLWEKAQQNIPVWRFNIEKPDIVIELHKEYIAAGSNIIFSNTFSANREAVEKTSYTVDEVVKAGVRLAKKAAEGTNVKVALDIGPLTELLEPYGDLEEEDAYEIYREQIGAGMSENPDLVVCETFMDIEMLKIAVSVANEYDVPVFCTMSFDKNGRTIMGNTVKSMVEGLADLKVAAIGLNCSLGPDLALPVIAQFREYTDLPLIFKPNAGVQTVKDGKTVTEFDVESFVANVIPAIDHGAVYLGGCCGSCPEYIKTIKEQI
ncbi:MAG: homocysteine S-methyltransferase family protein [Clostridia bacterium]|nr:homocysteine S-methyltransferase family protein [Clostridia bacterium]